MNGTASQPRTNPEYRAVALNLTNSAGRTPTDIAVRANDVSLDVEEAVSTVALDKSVCYQCSWFRVAYAFP
jgi:hypothetical protein